MESVARLNQVAAAPPVGSDATRLMDLLPIWMGQLEAMAHSLNLLRVQLESRPEQVQSASD